MSSAILPRAWVSVVRDADTTQTSLFSQNNPQEDDFSQGAQTPFLKGSLPESVFIDITNVKDIKLFFSGLITLCSPNDQIWKPLAIEATTNGLPSFQAPFSAFDVLSGDVKILKISISGLICGFQFYLSTECNMKYGQTDGGAAELKSDMMSNLSPFGRVVDCGLVQGIAGTFTGRGFVVLEVGLSSSNQLQHEVHWKYTYLSARGNLANSYSEAIKMHATWAKTNPFYRYCHKQEYVVTNRPTRHASLVCYHCHERVHIAKDCPKKNAARKGVHPPVVAEPLEPQTPIISHVPSVVSSVELTANEASSLFSVRTIPQLVIRTSKTVDPRPFLPSEPMSLVVDNATDLLTSESDVTGLLLTSSVPVCIACGQSDHKRRNHNSCPLNSKNVNASLSEKTVNSMEIPQTSGMDLDPRSSPSLIIPLQVMVTLVNHNHSKCDDHEFRQQYGQFTLTRWCILGYSV
ncbi:hypothetical protein A0J61_05131 [Choanephora cucurbitarum]|uniref:CCHC-type domain-containing protein n=1 Tax=Choanephora cucurbitarum TaxID=101091 RepID=A0A1C7NCH5_9FUNG|nr:hypothetical protein A0J61_05131 [Choanephora cucurbitarum]